MDYFAYRLPWKSILPQPCFALTCFLIFSGSQVDYRNMRRKSCLSVGQSRHTIGSGDMSSKPATKMFFRNAPTVLPESTNRA
jgi:hypothetical protein